MPLESKENQSTAITQCYRAGNLPSITLFDGLADDEFYDFSRRCSQDLQRRNFIEEFGFVPFTKESVDVLIAEISGKKVLEIGAGTGLLSRYLNKVGIDITAVDRCDGNYSPAWYKTPIEEPWFIKGDIEDIDVTEYDVLISVWAPMSDMLLRVLEKMKPGQVIFVEGEYNGCTANEDTFFYLSDWFDCDDELNKKLNEKHFAFPMIHDIWGVYAKRETVNE